MRSTPNLVIPIALLALSSSLAVYQLHRNRVVIAELSHLESLSERISVVSQAPTLPTSTSTTDGFPTIDVSMASDSPAHHVTIEETTPHENREKPVTVLPPVVIPAAESATIIPDVEPVETYDTEAYIAALTEAIHFATNNRRASRDIPELVYDLRLEKVAAERSLDMATRNYFSHTTPDGCDIECHFDATTLATIAWGENIGWYEPYQIRTPEELAEYYVDWWIDSRSHRENILAKDFTHEGIGVAVRNDKIIVTVVFADW